MARILIVLAILQCASISAQVSIGIRGGAAISTWHYNVTSGALPSTWQFDPKPIHGLGLAVSGEFRFRRWFALQPELGFITKGAKFEQVTNTVSYSEENRISYLELPLLAEFSLPLKAFSVNLLAGPYIGKTVKAVLRYGQDALDGSYSTPTTEVDVMSFYKPIDLGYVLAMRASGSYLRSTIFLEGRYMRGVLNVPDNFGELHVESQGQNRVEGSTLNRSWAVHIGYQFRLTKGKDKAPTQ